VSGRPSAACALVLAAGLGKRMRSALPKVLHPVGGRPMVLRVLQAARGAGLAEAVVVTGRGADAVEEAVRAGLGQQSSFVCSFARQEEQLGTGHAALRGLPLCRAQDVLILPGDAPLLQADELRRVLEAHAAAGAGVTLLTARLSDPTGYGRIVRDPDGGVRAIVEERDADPGQRAITEIFTLVACFRRDLLASALGECGTENAQGELYLPDAVRVARARGELVQALLAREPADVLGVNDRRALAAAEAALRARVLGALMEAGVTVTDPATTFVDEAAQVAPDVRLLPMTVVEGACRIAAGCEVGPGAHLRDSVLEAGCRVWHSVVEGSTLGPGCAVGPYAHLRPGCRLGRDVVVGNFAEVKNAVLGDGTKQHHHSYVGDADLGAAVNVGAGVVTVNFDGQRKHRTTVGDGAFLGCNANLIAPIEIGRGAFVAAGSTCDGPDPAGALGIARARLEVREGWVARRNALPPPPP
jgi:bifunctional UDP-N-acetylglucosamine pyrophosphorylase/glucosamine-1-phosphate N-acetyltransferase